MSSLNLIDIAGIFIVGFIVGSTTTFVAIKIYIEKKLEEVGLGGFIDGF